MRAGERMGTVEAFVARQFAAPEPSDRAKRSGASPEELFALVTHSSFRRSRLDDESASDIRAKIVSRWEQRAPIEFTILFGGYKNHSALSFPRPDWAEVFSLNYLGRFATVPSPDRVARRRNSRKVRRSTGGWRTRRACG